MDISPIRVVRAQCCAGNPQLRWCGRNGRQILQQRCQGGEHRNVNIGSGANTPGRAGRPIEHPGRNLQPSPGCPTREAATENLSASLLNHLMNMDQASGPRMPRIKKLVLRDPVGVPSSCCTMTSGRTGHWTKMHQSLVKFSESEASNHTPSLADFTTTTPELKFSVHTPLLLAILALLNPSSRAATDPGQFTTAASREKLIRPPFIPNKGCASSATAASGLTQSSATISATFPTTIP